ncbi:MAG: hypothetical protein WD876_00755 [Candidatus Pacearchaeota archaeon]
MEKKSYVIIGVIAVIVVALGVAYFVLNSGAVSSGGVSVELRYVPLSQVQLEKVGSAILGSDFIQDVPEKHPIALTFYGFEGNEQVVHDSFLIGKGQFLSEGEPEIQLALDAKYIDSFEEQGMCETIKQAINKGDLQFHSDKGKATLLIDYSGMLKHRDCFGVDF